MTKELAKIIDKVIQSPNTTGLIQIGSDKISKYDLLKEICSVYEKDVEINPISTKKCDKSLVSTLTSYKIPSHREMLTNLKNWYQK